MKLECNGTPIASHSLAKALGIKKFARNGHVLTIDGSLKTLIKSKGKVQISPVGINKISIFPGFCALHDTSLFRPIETSPFIGSVEQCGLLAYRAVARERYTKLSGQVSNDFVKTADAGLPISGQFAVQEFASAYGTGLQAAASDFDVALTSFHDALKTNNFKQFEHLVIEFAEEFPMLCSCAHIPNEDWSGEMIQDLTKLDGNLDWVSSVSLSSGDKSYVVFSWNRDSQKLRKFAKSLTENYLDQLSDAIIKYYFTISDNYALNDRWWKNLAGEQKACLMDRVNDGMPFSNSENIMKPKTGEPTVSNLKIAKIAFV